MGRYTCVATNSAGSAAYAADLHVNGTHVYFCMNLFPLSCHTILIFVQLHNTTTPAIYNTERAGFRKFSPLAMLYTTLYSIFAVVPYITPIEFDGPASAGDTVQISCNVPKGDKPLQIFWLLRGEVIGSKMGISTFPVGDRANFLSISYVTEKHAGNYTCQASNPAGMVELSSELKVNGTLFSRSCFLCCISISIFTLCVSLLVLL